MPGGGRTRSRGAQAGAHGSPLLRGPGVGGTAAPRCPPVVRGPSQVSSLWGGQLINSKGSELDISWLLSLCLIVSAGGGRGSRGYAGDGEVDKKGAGGPTELAFIAFAIALWLARPAWFLQGRPPCRRAGCPAVSSTLRRLGCARDRFKGPEGARSPSRGQRTFVAQPKGSPVGAQLGGEGFIGRQWKGGETSPKLGLGEHRDLQRSGFQGLSRIKLPRPLGSEVPGPLPSSHWAGTSCPAPSPHHWRLDLVGPVTRPWGFGCQEETLRFQF